MTIDLGGLKIGAVGALICALLLRHPAAPQLHAAGASFPYPLFSRWADTYQKESGAGVNYQSIGSGAGIRQIKAGAIVFGASDQPLNPEELEAAGLFQWPQIVGGVTPVVNLEGIGPGEIVLDGETLARIFLGAIHNWDDVAIRRLNPGVKLPAQPIIVVHRSDASGTTFVFTNYLSKVSSDWKLKVGGAGALEWPTGVGAKGNEGVANHVATTNGAIGYLEYAYAKQNRLAFTQMMNREGARVAPSAASFRAAIEQADWAHAPGFYQILTDQSGASSWPIVGATFILLPKRPERPDLAIEALKFFDWSFVNGGATAEALDYVSPAPAVVALIRKSWSENLREADGAPSLN